MHSSRGVKMPHDNRVSSSASLKMNDFWTKTIGYDPYSTGETSTNEEDTNHSAGLLLLAKMSNLSGSETRGACTRCGMVGHLTFQCRNSPKRKEPESSSSSSEDEEEKEEEEKERKEKQHQHQHQQIVVEKISKKRKASRHPGDDDHPSQETSRKDHHKKSRKESKKKSKKSKKKSHKSDR